MSAAAATAANPGVAAPPNKSKKKLVVIIGALVLLLVLGGAAAMLLLKKKPPADAEDAGDTPVAHASEGHAKPDLKHPPTFLPLDPFVVNLADHDVDRYAQIGVTFEIADGKFAEQLKSFMPAIRNGILMIISHKTSKDLLDRSGKEKLADEIQRDTARTLGLDVEEPAADEPAAAASAGDDDPKPKKKKKRPVEPNPIQHVHFSNFIVQ